MREKTVLLIDDSATIRRLVDNELSAAGYRVVLAATAEEGLSKARQEHPDLIILDHQLPGTTGFEVCKQLLASPETAQIPVVGSSTLRKKAYSEYLNCDNVVDMLPKPYTPEVLIATVENAINTAAMVVQSQSQGSAVPEVINELGEADLAGSFQCLGLREVIDMLNNGGKSGSLEIQTERFRIGIFLDSGRIQAVTGSGIDASEVAKYMPESLAELAPVIKFTVSGRRGSEVDGLCELLDNKVLDPRLLRKLLRLQAAVLLRFAFTSQLKAFRFDAGILAPTLYRKLPLDISLLALLVEGALVCREDELPASDPQQGFARQAIRGQNLDRAGLSSRHMNLLSVLAEPISGAQIAERLGWPAEEVRRVLHGFELAELIERRTIVDTARVFAVAAHGEMQLRLAALLKSSSDQFVGKLVRDWLALGLLLRRQKPQALVVEAQDSASLAQLEKMLREASAPLSGVRLVGICSSDASQPLAEKAAHVLDVIVAADCNETEWRAALSGQKPDAAAPGRQRSLMPAVAEISSTPELTATPAE